MTLVRCNPRRGLELWRPFSDLQTEINRLFGDSFRDIPATRGFVPAVDVLEKEDQITVKADLPGMNRDDLQVTVHDGVLTIRGSREHSEEVKEDNFSHVERSSGTFARSVQLPVEVESTKISASYKDGVLTIEAPKSAEARPRTIDVNVN
jgi:HSP20 family protein